MPRRQSSIYYNDSTMMQSFGQWLQEQLKVKTQKISVNAGFTCPNRDGTLGTGGCTFCNNQTFNPDYCQTSKSITTQLEEGKQFFARKYPDMRYLAYFQAYTNTYADLPTLQQKYEEALSVDGVVGLVIGTRPDCMPTPLLDYLALLSHHTFLIVEYGVESIYDRTLRRINRGHTWADSIDAIRRTADRGIHVGAHIILGLPGESIDDMMAEADTLSQLPLKILKLHQLQLIRGTAMAQEYLEHPDDFIRFTPDSYASLVARFVARTRPDIIFDRFVSQSPPHLLAQPGWGLKNHEFMALVEKQLKQGKHG